MKLFLSPHNDDAALFGAFTIQREKPLVLTVFDSHVQFSRGHLVTALQRRKEDLAAMKILGVEILFGGWPDSDAMEHQIEKSFIENGAQFPCVERVYAPAVEEGGHEQHNMIGRMAQRIWGERVTFYTTYTKAGKSRGSVEVKPTGEMIRRKLQALACYESQIDIEALGCQPHFLNDLREYYIA